MGGLDGWSRRGPPTVRPEASGSVRFQPSGSTLWSCSVRAARCSLFEIVCKPPPFLVSRINCQNRRRHSFPSSILWLRRQLLAVLLTLPASGGVFCAGMTGYDAFPACPVSCLSTAECAKSQPTTTPLRIRCASGGGLVFFVHRHIAAFCYAKPQTTTTNRHICNASSISSTGGPRGGQRKKAL